MANDADVSLDEMKEIVDDFLVEADELLHALDTGFVKLESTPTDLDLLNQIFRAAHTIKGTSSFLGFDQVTNLTHKMEDILNKLRKAEMAVTPAIMDALLEALDILKVLIQNVREHNGEELEIDPIMARLVQIAEGTIPPDDGAPAAPGPSSSPDFPADAIPVQPPAAPELKSAQKTTLKKPAADQTIRVDVDRLDSLMNLMGELVLGRNSLAQIAGKINNEDLSAIYTEQLNQATASISYITTELQMAVMKIRMQPIGKVFSKFPRLVRDLARGCGKHIDLQIFGEETELDKSVIEEIGDPLVHLIRNACDHGIEMPDVRRAKGKPATGVVRLSACQEGSNILIRIQDDGKGLDVSAIRDKAVERGLASRADIDKMSDKDVFRCIFEAGFSTAKVVTDVSGRGVGMDVVRTNIEKLSGIIELDSKPDQGATITIKLPLTLAILQGLPVEAGTDIFILPLSSVIETVKTAQSDVSYINRRPVLRLRNEIIPVVNLSQIYGMASGGVTLVEKPYIVVVGLADRKLGVNVDRFLGQEEVVIKSLGGYLGATEGIAGATILGDGRIRLIVDPLGLFHLARKTAGA